MITEGQNNNLSQLNSEKDCLEMLKMMLSQSRTEFDSNDEEDIVIAACEYIKKMELALGL